MKLKHRNFKSTTLNCFDLLGSNETGLSKSFAYLISVEPKVLYNFLRSIGIGIKNTSKNYLETTIEIEASRDEGRTDIEIRQKGKFHVIIECKVGKNRIKQQRTQYLTSFQNEPNKVLCFITQEHDCTREVNSDVNVFYRSWLDIIDLIDSKDFEKHNNGLINEFVSYATKGFKMRDQKEVLIQDLGNLVEVNRYKEFKVYRRDITFGTPLYFAPYFTRQVKQEEGEGICYLSKILGILTITPDQINSFEDELLMYADGNENTVLNWKKGVKSDPLTETRTYYFLDDPVLLSAPLLKDGGNKKGRGKNWISAKIPKNRCVTFQEFTRRMVMAYESN